LVAALATLAACSASEPAPAPEKAQTPEEALVGTYDVAKDHSYTDAVRGEVTEWGSWALTDGKMCSTPQGEGAKPGCVTLSEPAEDGTITVTADDGTVMTAKKLS
jgi:hypothetical protein